MRFLAKLLALELLLMGYWTNKQETEVSFTLQNCERKKISAYLHNDIHTYTFKKLCLKISQNVEFEFMNFGIFHQFLSY